MVLEADDLHLVRSARAGDLDAGELVRRNRTSVYRVALRMLGGPSDAEERWHLHRRLPPRGLRRDNTGKALGEDTRCKQALPYLERPEDLQGERRETTDAKEQCEAKAWLELLPGPVRPPNPEM